VNLFKRRIAVKDIEGEDTTVIEYSLHPFEKQILKSDKQMKENGLDQMMILRDNASPRLVFPRNIFIQRDAGS
jgi:hypothetical protein